MRRSSEFHSVYHTHHYTEKEKQLMNTFESFDYLPNDCHVYRNWLKQQPSQLDADRWFMMGLIGVVIGLIGMLLTQIISLLSEIKWKQTEVLIEVFRASPEVLCLSLLDVLIEVALMQDFQAFLLFSENLVFHVTVISRW